MVAPVVGITVRQVPWGVAWARVRAEAQLENSDFDAFPLMQSVLAGGEWSGRKLSTPQTASWLCSMLLKEGFDAEALSNVGSHSLKATALSWMAKAGIQKAHRRLLGGHTKPGDRSMAEYSRDELAEPLRHLSQTLTWIREDWFAPDATRAGLWSGRPREVAPSGAAQVLDGSADPFGLYDSAPGDDASEPGSSGSGSGKAASSDEEVEPSDAEIHEEMMAWDAKPVVDHDCLLPPYPDGGLMRASSRPYTIHAMKMEVATTECGIALSERHAMLPAWPETPWPRCKRCFRPAVAMR